jgi:hypothetical protein
MIREALIRCASPHAVAICWITVVIHDVVGRVANEARTEPERVAVRVLRSADVTHHPDAVRASFDDRHEHARFISVDRSSIGASAPRIACGSARGDFTESAARKGEGGATSGVADPAPVRRWVKAMPLTGVAPPSLSATERLSDRRQETVEMGDISERNVRKSLTHSGLWIVLSKLVED